MCYTSGGYGQGSSRVSMASSSSLLNTADFEHIRNLTLLISKIHPSLPRTNNHPNHPKHPNHINPHLTSSSFPSSINNPENPNLALPNPIPPPIPFLISPSHSPIPPSRTTKSAETELKHAKRSQNNHNKMAGKNGIDYNDDFEENFAAWMAENTQQYLANFFKKCNNAAKSVSTKYIYIMCV